MLTHIFGAIIAIGVCLILYRIGETNGFSVILLPTWGQVIFVLFCFGMGMFLGAVHAAPTIRM